MYETRGVGRRNQLAPPVLVRWQGSAGETLADASSPPPSAPGVAETGLTQLQLQSRSAIYRPEVPPPAPATPPGHRCRGELGEPSQLFLSFLDAALFPWENYLKQPFKALLKHVQHSALSRKTTDVFHFMFLEKITGWWIVKEHFIADKSHCRK